MKYRNYNISTFRNNFRNKHKLTKFLNLNEGLITSYDITKCEKHLMSKYPEIFEVNSLKFDRNSNSLYYKDKKSKKYHDNEFFEIKIDDISNLQSIEKTVYNLYGWFITRMIVFYKNSKMSKNNEHLFTATFDYIDNEFIYDIEYDRITDVITSDKFINSKLCETVDHYIILFEAKFTTSNDKFTELYHLTDFKNFNRIKRYGLIPKTNHNYNERIYFSPNIDDILEMVGDKFDIPVLLRLNLDEYENEIKQKYTFYNDPRMDYSLFTYDTINPKYIQVYKDEHWENI